MLKKYTRMLAVLLVFALTLAMQPVVLAARGEDTVNPTASTCIASSSASISAYKGTVTVSFSITGTGKMTSLGATKVQIKDSSGSVVKTFYSSTTSGMMGYNKTYHSGSVTYSGSTGTKYYAVVSFKAANATDSDTTTRTTGYTTA